MTAQPLLTQAALREAASSGAPGSIYIPADMAKGRNLVAAYCVGDCMEPTVRDGCWLITDPDAVPKKHDLVVYADASGQGSVARVHRKERAVLTLGRDNPAYPDVFKIPMSSICGVVVMTVWDVERGLAQT